MLVNSVIFLVQLSLIGRYTTASKRIPVQVVRNLIFHSTVTESNICERVICPGGAQCTVRNTQCQNEPCEVYAVCEMITREDSVCSLPVARGDCNYRYTNWYYDQRTSNCQQFEYSGCGGNGNRFSNARHCQVACHRRSQECVLKPETGPCRAAFRHWYYDAIEGRCKQFTYGGCQGNNNNFNTRNECNQACSGITVF